VEVSCSGEYVAVGEVKAEGCVPAGSKAVRFGIPGLAGLSK
jgi:hypothetical protein